jgi:hypothetical protein
VDVSSAVEIDRIEEQEVKIIEEEVRTGGFWGVEHIEIESEGQTDSIATKVWPMNITALAMHVLLKENMEGDEMTVEVAPDTTIGALTAPHGTGDTVLNVTGTVCANIEIGFYLRLLDASNGTTEQMRVIGVDKTACTVTMESPLVNTYNPAGPTYCQLTVKRVNRVKLPGFSGDITLGVGKLGGSHLPANTPVRITYHNNGVVDKTFFGYVEYLY